MRTISVVSQKGGAGKTTIAVHLNADGAALTAIRASDLVLIPCRPSAFNLAAIATTRELVRIEKKAAYIVLSAAPVRSALVAEASAGLAEEGAQIAAVVLHNRIAFSHAVIDGRTATEY